jgi:hypothetical protein
MLVGNSGFRGPELVGANSLRVRYFMLAYDAALVAIVVPPERPVVAAAGSHRLPPRRAKRLPRLSADRARASGGPLYKLAHYLSFFYTRESLHGTTAARRASTMR